jgi:hypothetical protein
MELVLIWVAELSPSLNGAVYGFTQISERTVRCEWNLARAWLHDEITAPVFIATAPGAQE